MAEPLNPYSGQDVPIEDSQAHQELAQGLDRMLTPRQRKRLNYRALLIEQSARKRRKD